MQANEQAAKRFITTRQGATPRDFEFKVNVNRNNSTYDILDDLYEKDYFSLPEISGEDMGNVTARRSSG